MSLSWQDDRAPAAVKAATAAAQNGTAECRRQCDTTHAPSDTSDCCDGMWLPTLAPKNIEELPGGRLQPSTIRVAADGAVNWRVSVRANIYSTLNVANFPFDRQVCVWGRETGRETGGWREAGTNTCVRPNWCRQPLSTTGAAAPRSPAPLFSLPLRRSTSTF